MRNNFGQLLYLCSTHLALNLQLANGGSYYCCCLISALLIIFWFFLGGLLNAFYIQMLCLYMIMYFSGTRIWGLSTSTLEGTTDGLLEVFCCVLVFCFNCSGRHSVNSTAMIILVLQMH